MSDKERACCLTLDEMSLKSKVDMDPSQGCLIGGVTLPDHHGLANHALVFMLGGITTRWKQTVAYHFTGQGMDGTVLKQIALDIIQEAHKIGLHVMAICSDMGSANRAMWRSFGIRVTAKEVVNRIPHPIKQDSHLYFLADAPHLLKNIKQAFITGRTFMLPSDTCTSECLTSLSASVAPVKDLAAFQVSHYHCLG